MRAPNSGVAVIYLSPSLFLVPSPHWKQKTPIRRDLAYIIHARSMLFTVSSVFLFPHFVCVPVFYYQMIIAQWLLLSASNPMIHRHRISVWTAGMRAGLSRLLHPPARTYPSSSSVVFHPFPTHGMKVRTREDVKG